MCLVSLDTISFCMSKKVGEGRLEAFGPKMFAVCSVDELHVHAKPITAALHGPFKHVTGV